jgi:hypothetical protein
MGLHTSPIDLCSAPVHFFITVYPRLVAPVGKGKDKVTRDLLRASKVIPPTPAPSIALLLLLCGPLRHRRSPHAAPSPAPSCRLTTSTMWPASPDGVGTAALTRGDRSLGYQLATEAAAQGEASGPGTEALRSRLMLRLRRPDADGGGGHTVIQCMLQAYISNVLDVLDVCCKCFIRML